ncbi:MAG: hypothetical protein OEZ52_16035, partial [Candidatus Aminicenantes bacterium]|nr:hypothetical protein [Candidatus Aminicenantes bacterium]
MRIKLDIVSLGPVTSSFALLTSRGASGGRRIESCSAPVRDKSAIRYASGGLRIATDVSRHFSLNFYHL